MHNPPELRCIIALLVLRGAVKAARISPRGQACVLSIKIPHYVCVCMYVFFQNFKSFYLYLSKLQFDLFQKKKKN